MLVIPQLVAVGSPSLDIEGPEALIGHILLSHRANGLLVQTDHSDPVWKLVEEVDPEAVDILKLYHGPPRPLRGCILAPLDLLSVFLL